MYVCSNSYIQLSYCQPQFLHRTFYENVHLTSCILFKKMHLDILLLCIDDAYLVSNLESIYFYRVVIILSSSKLLLLFCSFFCSMHFFLYYEFCQRRRNVTLVTYDIAQAINLTIITTQIIPIGSKQLFYNKIISEYDEEHHYCTWLKY